MHSVAQKMREERAKAITATTARKDAISKLWNPLRFELEKDRLSYAYSWEYYTKNLYNKKRNV